MGPIDIGDTVVGVDDLLTHGFRFDVIYIPIIVRCIKTVILTNEQLGAGKDLSIGVKAPSSDARQTGGMIIALGRDQDMFTGIS